MNQLSTIHMSSGDSVLVNANGRQIEITCQGSVVMVQDMRTENVLLMRTTKNMAILGEQVYVSNVSNIVQEIKNPKP